MAISIDRVLSNAVNGARKGLQTARKDSAQLAVAGSGTVNPDENKTNTRVEKVANADLGKLVDVKV